MEALKNKNEVAVHVGSVSMIGNLQAILMSRGH